MDLQNRLTPFVKSYMPVPKKHRITRKKRRCKSGYRKSCNCVRKNKLLLETDRCPKGMRYRSDTRVCEPVERYANPLFFYQ